MCLDRANPFNTEIGDATSKMSLELRFKNAITSTQLNPIKPGIVTTRKDEF
jgi:hypothetical protein